MDHNSIEALGSNYIDEKIKLAEREFKGNKLITDKLTGDVVNKIKTETIKSVKGQRKPVNFPRFMTTDAEQQCCYSRKELLLEDFPFNLNVNSAFELELIRRTSVMGELIDSLFKGETKFWQEYNGSCPEPCWENSDLEFERLFNSLEKNFEFLFYWNYTSTFIIRDFLINSTPDISELENDPLYVKAKTNCLAEMDLTMYLFTEVINEKGYRDYLESSQLVDTIKRRRDYIVNRNTVKAKLLKRLKDIFPERSVLLTVKDISVFINQIGDCGNNSAAINWFTSINRLFESDKQTLEKRLLEYLN